MTVDGGSQRSCVVTGEFDGEVKMPPAPKKGDASVWQGIATKSAN